MYDTDYNLWLTKTVSLLKEQQFSELDLPNLVEELEALVRADKNALASNLVVLIQHLLK